MEIQVKDLAAAYSTCESISKYSKEMNTQIDSLDTVLSNINSKWESNGQDKESYMVELRKQAENLTFINEQINMFVSKIKIYLNSIQETSSKTL